MVLCGRNDGLRRRLDGLPGVTALGWRRDLPALLARSAALVDNAAGQTALQALALGVPVVAYRPLPGHGREGVRAMADLGLSHLAETSAELVAALQDAVSRPGEAAPASSTAAARLFPGSAATVLAELAGG
jgi:UDP-N-acetylglucosamine:LPS N-acetylglucosamine transferase